MKKEIRLNAFAMNCVAHQSPGLWTHPRDRTADYIETNPITAGLVARADQWQWGGSYSWATRQSSTSTGA